jgi:hypothetical protein
MRPAGLKLPAVDVAFLRQAIAPLRSGWLIREEPITDGDVRYELAHDFAVRSVIRAWTELDRRRIQDLALLSRRRDEVEQKVADLARLEQTGLLAVVGLPVMGLAGLALITVRELILVGYLFPLAVWGVFASAVSLLTAAIITRVRIAILAAIPLAGVALSFMYGVIPARCSTGRLVLGFS